MPTLFVTATSTDVGKTYVTCALIRTLRAQGRAVDAFKPALSGYTRYEGSDAALLLDALGQPASGVDRMSPLRFAAALAPPSAARAEGKSVDQGVLNRLCRIRMGEIGEGLLLIEGIGGVMSPIADGATSIDLICDLEVPAILVAGSYLGSVTHTLTAIESLKARYVPISAVIVSESAGDNPDLEEMTLAMAEFVRGIPVFVAPRAPDWDASALATHLVGA